MSSDAAHGEIQSFEEVICRTGNENC